MTGSPTPAQHVGVLRTEQGWIGGTSPLDAHLVTPPPDEVPALLDALIAYVNRHDIDPVSQAAVAHAQFELIHPFADGNGRVGRVLDLLPRHLVLTGPTVARELDIPLKSANAALGELVHASILVEQGRVHSGDHVPIDAYCAMGPGLKTVPSSEELQAARSRSGPLEDLDAGY